MSFMQAKLAQLETRLQMLIEGSAAWLVPFQGVHNDLSHQLVEAMRAGIQQKSDGSLRAPNLFTLIVNPVTAQILRENQILLEDLADVIRQTGEEANLRFDHPPAIKVALDPDIPPGGMRIETPNNSQELDDTGTMAMLLDPRAKSVPDSAFLIVNGGRVFPLTQAVINLGRRPDNHIVIDDARVSRVHAQLRAIKGRYTIFDLDSTGGTFVNGLRVQQCSLYPGDVISLAGVALVFGQETSPQPGNDENSTRPMDSLPAEE